MKVLASYPSGLATHEALKRDLEFLATSGDDWKRRSRQLAAALPSLDIFTLGFVERYSFGWRLTKKGLIALEMMEEVTAHSDQHAVPAPSDRDVAPTASKPPAIILQRPAATDATRFDRRSRLTLIQGGKPQAA